MMWNLLGEDDNSKIYEWETNNCKKADDQHEIARVIAGKEAMYVIHYATKKVPVDSNKRQKWISLLNSITLVIENSQESSPLVPR